MRHRSDNTQRRKIAKVKPESIIARTLGDIEPSTTSSEQICRFRWIDLEIIKFIVTRIGTQQFLAIIANDSATHHGITLIKFFTVKTRASRIRLIAQNR